MLKKCPAPDHSGCRALLCIHHASCWHVFYSGNKMNSAAITTKAKQQVPTIARLGLIAKGFVYLLLGTFVLMSALNIRQQSDTSSKTGVLKALDDSIAGHWVLPLLAVGLVCYAAWRYYQTYQLSQTPKRNGRKWCVIFSAAASIFLSGILPYRFF